MGKKLVVIRGGNRKPVSLPAKVADGLVKMKKATYHETKPAVVKPKTTEKKTSPFTPYTRRAATTPKTSPTYGTRAMTAEKPKSEAEKGSSPEEG